MRISKDCVGNNNNNDDDDDDMQTNTATASCTLHVNLCILVETLLLTQIRSMKIYSDLLFTQMNI